jgi:hypothetical protein
MEGGNLISGRNNLLISRFSRRMRPVDDAGVGDRT